MARRKKKKQPTASPAIYSGPPNPEPLRRRAEPTAAQDSTGWSFILLLAGAALLRLIRIDTPIGGFHALNEGNYILIAKNFLHGPLLLPSPDGRYIFLETPPLYPYLLAGVFTLTGVSVLAARIVSVLSSIGLIVATYVLGRRLFGAATGIAAALLITVCPLAVLTGRNIQTDSLLLLLLMAALAFYPRTESGSDNWIAFGLLSGLALFTKLFAVIPLAAVFAWELAWNRGGRIVKDRGFWRGIACMAALPLAFYGYHAVRDFSHLRRDVTGGAAVATKFPSSGVEWTAVAAEAIWAFSPILAALLLVGIGAAVAKLSREIQFVLLPLVALFVFYLFVHKHSYYLLTVLPFAALLAGKWLASLPSAIRFGLLSAAVATGVFLTLIDLTGMKLGFLEFEELGKIARGLPEEHSLLVSREIRYSYGTALTFYDPKARLVTLEDLPKRRDGGRRPPEGDSFLLTLVPPRTESLASGWLLRRDRFGLELFGLALAEAHPNPHFFRQGRYISQNTGGLFDFGFELLRNYPAMALVPVPQGVNLYSTPQGLAIRPIDQAPDRD